MNDAINGCIVYWSKLCDKYIAETYCVSQQMKNMSQISFELLKKVVFLEVPFNSSGEIDVEMKNVENILLKDHVMVENSSEDRVTIKGFEAIKEGGEKVYPHVWGLFQYTYRLTEWPECVRNKFLWATILFPYVYRMNLYLGLNYDMLAHLWRQYSVEQDFMDWLKELEANVRMGKIVDVFDEIMSDTGLDVTRDILELLKKRFADGIDVVVRVTKEKSDESRIRPA